MNNSFVTSRVHLSTPVKEEKSKKNFFSLSAQYKESKNMQNKEN